LLAVSLISPGVAETTQKSRMPARSVKNPLADENTPAAQSPVRKQEGIAMQNGVWALVLWMLVGYGQAACPAWPQAKAEREWNVSVSG
jgi:hypothetical protein